MSFLESHAQFESRSAEDREQAQDAENSHHARYVVVHGSDQGYVPGRSFPCPGSLRKTDEGEHWRTIECDACGFSVAAPIARTTTRTETPA